MRRLFRPVLSCLLAGAVFTVLDAADVKVKTEYDRSADFTAVRSYAWLPTPPYRTHVAPEADDRFLAQDTLDAPIHAAIDRALAAKGLAPATSGAPDCFLVYYAAFGMDINASVMGENYAYITGWGSPLLGATPTTSLRVIEQGTLVLDMLNRDKKVAIWRGTATGAVDRDRTDEQRRRVLDEAAQKMFKNFPPGK